MGKITRDLIEYNGIEMCSHNSLSSFKQMNTDYVFCLPDAKPDIEQIIKVWIDACVISSKLVKTPVGTSLEGQTVTGYKLLISADISLKFQYVACDTTQTIHSAHTVFPISGYIVLPENFNPSSAVRPYISIEDIFSEQMDCRCIYSNITMMFLGDVC